jgi:hypothetical protein
LDSLQVLQVIVLSSTKKINLGRYLDVGAIQQALAADSVERLVGSVLKLTLERDRSPLKRGVMRLRVFNKMLQSCLSSTLERGAFLTLCWVLLVVSICNAQDLSQEALPQTCEIHSRILDMTRNEALWGSSKNSAVIAIARLGDGEISRQLNRRRLYNLMVHWKDYQLPEGKLVAAEGERVSGFGRVELYVAGKLFDTLVVKRGKDLCVDCCEPDERLYPYRQKANKYFLSGPHNKRLQRTRLKLAFHE